MRCTCVSMASETQPLSALMSGQLDPVNSSTQQAEPPSGRSRLCCHHLLPGLPSHTTTGPYRWEVTDDARPSGETFGRVESVPLPPCLMRPAILHYTGPLSGETRAPSCTHKDACSFSSYLSTAVLYVSNLYLLPRGYPELVCLVNTVPCVWSR